MVADPGARPLGQAERVLELGAAGEQRPRRALAGQRKRRRDVAARAAEHPRAAGRARTTESSVRVWIGRSWTQEQVGDVAEALECVVVAVGDRLVGHVGAGHHERLADFVQQQVVKRRVREHHAELGRSRRDRLRRPAHRAPRVASTIGRSGLGQQLRGRPRRATRATRRRAERRRHQRERLVLAMLARPQRRHRALVAGQAGQVVAADALDRDDRAVAQRGGGGGRAGRAERLAVPEQPTATVRRPGTRSAGRGSAGRRGPRTRPGTAGTS